MSLDVHGKPKAGSTLIIESGILNKGKSDSGKFRVKWMINKKTEASARYDGIDAGSTIKDNNTTFSWRPRTPGTYRISFVIEPDSKSCEQNKSNNTVTRTVVVKR